MTNTNSLSPEAMRDRFWELRAQRDKIHDEDIQGIRDRMEVLHVQIRELEAQLVPLQAEIRAKMDEASPIDVEMGMLSRALKFETARPEVK